MIISFIYIGTSWEGGEPPPLSSFLELKKIANLLRKLVVFFYDYKFQYSSLRAQKNNYDECFLSIKINSSFLIKNTVYPFFQLETW